MVPSVHTERTDQDKGELQAALVTVVNRGVITPSPWVENAWDDSSPWPHNRVAIRYRWAVYLSIWCLYYEGEVAEMLEEWVSFTWGWVYDHVAWPCWVQTLFRIGIRIRMFLGILDPNTRIRNLLERNRILPIYKQKFRKNLFSTVFVTSLRLFVFEEGYQCTFKKEGP